MPVELKRSEVMFAMWVIVLGEIFELGNPLGQRFYGDIQLFQQVSHTSSDKSLPGYAWIASAECIIELGYPLDCLWCHVGHLGWAQVSYGDVVGRATED